MSITVAMGEGYLCQDSTVVLIQHHRILGHTVESNRLDRIAGRSVDLTR